MPDSKKTFHKRPTFSAPTPPSKKSDDLVVNHDDDAPILEEVVVNEPATTTEAESFEPEPETRLAKKTLPVIESDVPESVASFVKAKTVSRSLHHTAESSLDEVLTPPDSTTEPAEPTLVRAESIATDDKSTRRTNIHLKGQKSQGAPPMNFLLVVITLFSLIFGVSGWALYFKEAGSLELPTNMQTNNVSPTPEGDMAQGEPTPAVVVTNLEVLNGSGVAGIAAKTATTLEGLGYTVVRTGNADNQNYATTQILVNKDYAGTESLLEKLKAEFDSAENSGELTDSTASARIVVGKDWTQ